jgi:hypothetical protein
MRRRPSGSIGEGNLQITVIIAVWYHGNELKFICENTA